MVPETVKSIEGLLSEVAALQKEYVDRVCGVCKSPCCKRVHYLFNEKDIIFLKLSGRKHKWRRESFKQKGCWFLGPSGCTLDPESRPFICNRYLCGDLRMEMKGHDPDLIAVLDEKFKTIDTLRSQLWGEYLENR
jgi:hypothetical protein